MLNVDRPRDVGHAAANPNGSLIKNAEFDHSGFEPEAHGVAVGCCLVRGTKILYITWAQQMDNRSAQALSRTRSRRSLPLALVSLLGSNGRAIDCIKQDCASPDLN